MKGEVIPHDIHVKITRNYGETSQEKAMELIEHLLIATFAVVLLIAFALGWREAIIIAFTVPTTLSIALFLSEIYGFTLNRVTLFTILATFTVIVALMPMAFVTGMMGPYMRPIPINASVAMFFSMLVAFILTPYLALRLLRNVHKAKPVEEKAKEYEARAGVIALLLEKIYLPLFESRLKRWIFLGFIGFLMAISVGLLSARVVLKTTFFT